MKKPINAVHSTAKNAIFGVSALILSFCAAGESGVVLNMNFNHGTRSPAESPYIASAGEVMNATYKSTGGFFSSTSFARTPTKAPEGGGGQSYFSIAQDPSSDNHAGFHTTNHPAFSGSFTIEFLYRPKILDQSIQTLFYGTNNSSNGISLIDVYDHKVRFDLFNGGYTYTSRTSLNPDRWYHIALVYDDNGTGSEGGQNRLYINGVLDGTQAFGPGPEYIGINSEHYLFANPAFGDRNLNGYVDGVAISKGVLTPGKFILETPVAEPTTGVLIAAAIAMTVNRRRRVSS